MATFESHTTGDDTVMNFYGVNWAGQTFTPSAKHTITSVKLLLLRAGATPGTITVSIRATDGSGHPTPGDDLCSGTTTGNDLTTDAGGEWREITLGAGTILSSGIKYAIVCRAPTGDAGNYVSWRNDSDNGYASGTLESSANSGVDWTTYSAYDVLFEDIGTAITEKSYGFIIG